MVAPTPRATAVDAFDISSKPTMAVTMSADSPPYSSGMEAANSPIAAALSQTSGGMKSRVSSHSRIFSLVISFSQNSRTVARMSSCSSVKEKSIV